MSVKIYLKENAMISIHTLGTEAFWKTLQGSKLKGIKAGILALAARRAANDIQKDSANLREVWEWRAAPDDLDPVKSDRWTQIEAALVQSTTWEQADAMRNTRQAALQATRP